MKCPYCGTDDPILRDYCISCGEKLEHGSEYSEAALIEAKRDEREKRVAKRIRSWVVITAAVMVALITFKSAGKSVPHEEVDAYFPPPVIDLASAERLPVVVARLPVPEQKRHNIRPVQEKESEIVHKLVKTIMLYAPEYRLKDGSKIRGFLLSQHGDSAIIYTGESRPRVVPLATDEKKKTDE
ncbi:MAG TPA: TFIIB-type zinc ribbon-containing protein [Planctomycetota bacterium]|nr:TFIIB-type zinc ribbon-containing protein [Planctomycetota bacterium]